MDIRHSFSGGKAGQRRWSRRTLLVCGILAALSACTQTVLSQSIVALGRSPGKALAGSFPSLAILPPAISAAPWAKQLVSRMR